jgi:fermentation-respiration switch protein FrsA (DUF1100 family)
MLQVIHAGLMAAYIFLPPAFAVVFIVRSLRRGRASRIWPRLTVAVATALLLGVCASIIYDLWLGGIVGPGQMLLTSYWAAGLICILKLLDVALDAFTRVCFSAIRVWSALERQSAAQVIRVMLLFFIGLPYMIAAAATYRPKAELNPKSFSSWSDLGASEISFRSDDGLELAGFWTPAPARPPGGGHGTRWGRQTLIICPGARGGRAAYLQMANSFLDRGYNVLSFDFRAQGQSGGQIVSFGANEKRDVLAAVRWVRGSYPLAARRIVAIGVDTGGAALLAAAADPSPEGRAIEAMAVFGCFDRFTKLAASAAQISFPPPLGWLIVPVAVPLASLQSGADLLAFSPADLTEQIAPRPILFIHGEHDPVISFERGRALYEAASAPKDFIWLDDLTDDQAVNEPSVVNRARHFLDVAVPML